MCGSGVDRCRLAKARSFVRIWLLAWTPVLLVNAAARDANKGFSPAALPSFVEQYCAGCHNSDKRKGDLDLESISTDEVSQRPQVWEKVVRRLRVRQMPPAEKRRPD